MLQEAGLRVYVPRQDLELATTVISAADSTGWAPTSGIIDPAPLVA